jgi:hypothetical protein
MFHRRPHLLSHHDWQCVWYGGFSRCHPRQGHLNLVSGNFLRQVVRQQPDSGRLILYFGQRVEGLKERMGLPLVTLDYSATRAQCGD